MYGIFTYIGVALGVNVCKYASPMECLGYMPTLTPQIYQSHGSLFRGFPNGRERQSSTVRGRDTKQLPIGCDSLGVADSAHQNESKAMRP